MYNNSDSCRGDVSQFSKHIYDIFFPFLVGLESFHFKKPRVHWPKRSHDRVSWRTFIVSSHKMFLFPSFPQIQNYQFDKLRTYIVNQLVASFVFGVFGLQKHFVFSLISCQRNFLYESYMQNCKACKHAKISSAFRSLFQHNGSYLFLLSRQIQV